MSEFVAAIEAAVPAAAGLVTFEERSLPFPQEIDHAGLAVLGRIPETPLHDGVRATAELFRRQLERGIVRPEHYGLSSEAPGARAGAAR